MTPSRLAAVRSRIFGVISDRELTSLFPAILGATNPLASAPGTIRGDFAIDVGRNVCHGSDSVESAKKEISLWFKEGDVVSYKASQFDWIYEKA